MADFTSISTWRNMFTKYGSKLGWGLVLLFGIPLIAQFGLNAYQGNGAPAAKNVNTDETVMKINGQAISRAEVNGVIGSVVRGQQPGLRYAEAEGDALLQGVAQRAVVQQMAAQRGAHPDDADVDKALVQMRESIAGKDVSDSEWRTKLMAQTGKTVSELRDSFMKDPQFLAQALIKSYEKDVKVTEDDARNQHAQVRFVSVMVPVGPAPTPGSKNPPLSDADAKKKAGDLLAKAKAGADIAALSKANNGRDSNLQPEYADATTNQMVAFMGALGYGKEFDEVVHKTANGGFTEVVKASGFSSGYVFAKVTDRKVTLPPGFDVKKEVAALQKSKAQTKAAEDVKKAIDAAKVEVIDSELKAYYDYAKLQQDKQKMGMPPSADKPAPTAAQISAAEQSVQIEFDALNKKNPKDATVALVLAEFIKNQQYDPKLTPAQQDAVRDRLQGLYETALVSTEDSAVRENLAAIYRRKNLNDKAAEQYKTMSQILVASGAADVRAAQEAQKTHLKLASEFTSVNKPDLAAKEKDEAAKMNGQIAQLQQAEAEQRRQQAEAQRKQQEEAAKAAAAAKGGKAGANAPGGAAIAPQGGAVPGATMAPPIQVTPGGTAPVPIQVTPKGP